MGLNTLSIVTFNTPEQAPNYKEPEYRGASLDGAVIVGNGTSEGLATVDLIFTDKSGQKYIAMITGGLMKNLAGAITGVELRTRNNSSTKH